MMIDLMMIDLIIVAICLVWAVVFVVAAFTKERE